MVRVGLSTKAKGTVNEERIVLKKRSSQIFELDSETLMKLQGKKGSDAILSNIHDDEKNKNRIQRCYQEDHVISEQDGRVVSCIHYVLKFGHQMKSGPVFRVFGGFNL